MCIIHTPDCSSGCQDQGGARAQVVVGGLPAPSLHLSSAGFRRVMEASRPAWVALLCGGRLCRLPPPRASSLTAASDLPLHSHVRHRFGRLFHGPLPPFLLLLLLTLLLLVLLLSSAPLPFYRPLHPSPTLFLRVRYNCVHQSLYFTSPPPLPNLPTPCLSLHLTVPLFQHRCLQAQQTAGFLSR